MAFGEIVAQQSDVAPPLQEVESEVLELIDTIATSRLRLCQCLGLIERYRLYKAIGARDFKDYLRRQRIPLPYQTAQQYAAIGHVLEDEAEFLNSVGYSEADGLCKLRFLRAALERYSDQDEVAHHLTNDSFRQFRNYAKEISVPTADPSEDGCRNGNRTLWERVCFGDDTIRVIAKDGCPKDLVWLNPDAFDDESQYRSFVQMTIALVEQVGGIKWPFLQRSQAKVS